MDKLHCVTRLKSVTGAGQVCTAAVRSSAREQREASLGRMWEENLCGCCLCWRSNFRVWHHASPAAPSQLGLMGRFMFSSTESRGDLSCWVIFTQIPVHSTGRAGKIAGSKVRKLNPAGVNFLVLDKKVIHAGINISYHLLVFMSIQTRFHRTEQEKLWRMLHLFFSGDWRIHIITRVMWFVLFSQSLGQMSKPDEVCVAITHMQKSHTLVGLIIMLRWNVINRYFMLNTFHHIQQGLEGIAWY